MKPEAFLERFDLFADAPDAVAKMRGLVRHLAVTGKLVAQDPNDEPAEQLIARIGGIRRTANANPKEYQPVSEGQIPYDVPSSWALTRLGNLSLTSDSGWSPQCLPESREGDDWGVLKVSAVSWGVFKPEENKALPPGMEPRPVCEVRPGDFLVSRANTEDLVARSVVVVATPPRLMMSDKIVRFTFPDEIDRAFINLANTSETSRAYYARNASGTSSSMKNVGREVMCNLPIALPPLAEQKRIVAKVDELMVLCDQLEALQEERETLHAALARASLANFANAPNPANLELLFHKSYSIPPADLRKSILNLAVQGHLKLQSGELGFPQVRLDRLGAWAQGCGFPISEQGHPDREILFAKVSDMNLPGNEREILRTNHTIDEATAKRLRIKVHPPGTVIFPKIGGAIATNKRRVLVRPTAIDNNCSGIIPNESCSTSWVFLVLSAIDFAEYQSGTSVPAVNQGALGEIAVSLPTLEEQQRIVTKVEELLALVEVLDGQLATARSMGLAVVDAAIAELAAET